MTLTSPTFTRPSRAVLVVGHPGHELRVYGWLAAARPLVQVITDGSGGDGVSRVPSTTTLLDDVGATPGSIYGRLTDRDVYAAMLAGDQTPFVALAEELAETLVRSHVDIVAGDGIEGFNPSHDVCRYTINAAVRLASAVTGRTIRCYAFPLEGAPETRPNGVLDGAMRLRLDDDMLGRKMRAAHAYPELRSEVERTLAKFGSEAFRSECLWPVDLADPYGWDSNRVPYYESYGAQRVQSGTYERVVTFREHVRPIADALWCRCAVIA